ncbi:MAG: MOSC domain-containing protein, partial [Gammaproteobacteria bacterium]
MKILSINVSEPQKVTFNGKELITSIYKKPVSNKVQVTSHGIEGDRQADLSVHGGYDKAVYAYSYSHYKLWGEHLKKEFNEYGLVGENLTIDNFDENDIRIGDR